MENTFKKSTNIRDEYDVLYFQKEIDKAKNPGGPVLRIIFLGPGSEVVDDWSHWE
jgi:hypothetical protein